MPSPTPGPSPTSSPTPTPSISYLAYDELTGSREFSSSCGNWYGTQATTTEGFSLYPANPEALAHKYDAPTESWEIRGYARDGDAGLAQNGDGGPEFEYLFDPNRKDPASTGEATRYGYIDTNGTPVVFSIIQRTLGTQPAQYVRETRLVAKPGVYKIEVQCVIGVPTTYEDTLPATRFAYGNFAIAGTAHGGTADYDLRDSTATWTIDPVTGETKATINFVGRAITPSGLSSTRTNLGSYNTPPLGMLNLQLPFKSFSGGLYDSNYKGAAFESAAGRGAFGGSFFGPQGIEMGVGFAVVGPALGTSYWFTGTLIGRR